MKIVIVGADGQLGTDLCKVMPKTEQVPLTLADLDITNREQSLEVIASHKPDVVINTAAYHNVDQCEDEVEAAFKVNACAVKYLAEACQKCDAVLAHISTDYVFDGEKRSPYVETDQPNPQSIYAISKLAGEKIVQYMLTKYFIVRSSGLYGATGCLGKGGTNFVEGMLKRAARQSELKVVTDEVLAPTYTLDLAQAINALIRTDQFGLYHLVNDGACSWHDFTVKIFELLNKKVVIHKVTSETFKTKAKRPAYSVLKSAKLKQILRPWQAALSAYLIEKGYLT